MSQDTLPQARELAETALKRAETHCLNANIDPAPYIEILTEIVIDEITQAIRDIAHDRVHTGPRMALALNQPYFRDIYFADASRRAAHTLIQNLGGNTGAILTTAKNDTLRANYPK